MDDQNNTSSSELPDTKPLNEFNDSATPPKAQDCDFFERLEEMRAGLTACTQGMIYWVNRFLWLLIPDPDRIVETDRLVDTLAEQSLELPDPIALLRHVPIDETMDPLDLPTMVGLLDHIDLCMRIAERSTDPRWRKSRDDGVRRYGQTGIILYALKVQVVNAALKRFFGDVGVLDRPEDAHKQIQISPSSMDPDRMIEIRFPASAPFVVPIFHLQIWRRLLRLLGRVNPSAAPPIAEASRYSQDPTRSPTPEQLALLRRTLNSR